ncbi:unnamed protein product [Orchesella dallaii]|uniref:Uncharacterized protein n=1 Tax=Orchesella dallaii TaxID=48710 RepID=A0ABP1PUT4_9HEXA
MKNTEKTKKERENVCVYFAFPSTKLPYIFDRVKLAPMYNFPIVPFIYSLLTYHGFISNEVFSMRLEAGLFIKASNSSNGNIIFAYFIWNSRYNMHTEMKEETPCFWKKWV